MSADDDAFLRELQAAFQVEAGEHLQAMSAGLVEWEQSPTAERQAAVLERVYREAHSLKGAARAVNRADIEALCQSLESVFADWKRRESSPPPALYDTLHDALDLAGALLADSSAGEATSGPDQISQMTQQLARVEAETDGATAPATPSPAAPVPRSPQNVTTETVRIATAKLDALLRQAEEMLSVKLTTRQRAADLWEARTILERWRKEWATLYPDLRTVRQSLARGEEGRPAPPLPSMGRLLEFIDWNYACIKSLESQVTTLAKATDHDRREIDGKIDTLLEDTKRLLMLPFSTLLAGFPKLVRDLSRDEGKEVQLVMQGSGVEIDKRILEEMKDPLIHLLRNSVDHGIEAPQERTRRHKPALATVTISISQIGGSEVEILVSDDGDGIDLGQVRAAAVEHGVIPPDVADQLNEAESLALIFLSEISTSPHISEISGRGLGMAIVREKVERLGGRIAVETRRGQGTTFRILLPLMLATFKGILVQVADQVFVIPTSGVDRVLRVSGEEIKTVERRETVALNDRLLSLVRLSDVLGLPSRPAGSGATGGVPALVLGTGEKQIAFRVDAILDEREVLVKAFRPPILRVRNVAGATILSSGRPAPILNTADLLKTAQGHGYGEAPEPVSLNGSTAEANRKAILLAEDSITSRMLLKNILEAAGYTVTIAVDGIDALTALKTQKFALAVSDVDMPRMDGFELTARIRADKALADLPVVLVTARDSQTDRERGVDAGASAYLVKSNFDQSNLLTAIRRLI